MLRRGLRRLSGGLHRQQQQQHAQQQHHRSLITLANPTTTTTTTTPTTNRHQHQSLSRRPLATPLPTTHTIPHRTFKYHEKGWWEDEDSGGVVGGQPNESNPEVYKSMLCYVSDARKEEIYRLNKLDPSIFDAAVLSYLFNLSRARVTAIIQLKAEEVHRRLKGQLYTEEDDVFDEELAATSASPHNAPTSKKSKKGGGKTTAKPIDPTDLLLLDEESGLETLEDLSRPPGWAPPEKDQQDMLSLQAALQQSQLIEQLGLTGEDAAAMMKPFKEKIDDAQLDSLLAKLDVKMAAAQAETEEEMYGAEKQWEKKGLDEVPDPVNGFRMLEKLDADILETPAFLQYHTWMNLEKERLELLLAQVRAKHDRQGGNGHLPVTPYEDKELMFATEAYTRKRERAAVLFARLRVVHEAVHAQTHTQAETEGEEGKEEVGEEEKEKRVELVKQEKELLKVIKQELAPRIMDMEELSEVQEEVGKQVKNIAARQRRAVLGQALRSQEEGGGKRKEKLKVYMGMLEEVVKGMGREEADQVFAEVKWEVLQQHRRAMRQDEEGKEIYERVGGEEAHAVLEQELMEVILNVEEGEVKGLYAQMYTGAAAAGEEQRKALRAVLGKEGKERGEAMGVYVKALFAEFSWSSPSSSSEDVGGLSRQAYQLLLKDIHESQTLRGRVDELALAHELMDLQEEGQDAAENTHTHTLDLLQGASESAGGFTITGKKELDTHTQIRELELGYQAGISHDLHTLQKARVQALRASRGGGGKGIDEKSLRRYMVLAAVSSQLEAFDLTNQHLLARVLTECVRVFRGKTETVQAAYNMMVHQLYGAKEIEASEITALAQMAGRSDGWVEGVLEKVVKEVEKEMGGGGGDSQTDTHTQTYGGLPDGSVLVKRMMSEDCFAAGIRSGVALKALREEMAGVVGKVVTSDIEAIEDEFEYPGDVEEVQDLLLEALEEGPIGSYTEPSVEVADGLRMKELPIEERARAAKALLEYLRRDGSYKDYAGPVKDRLVEEIEEELMDTIYEISDELKMDLDPHLVDMKPKEHYDVPSLKFRVLHDNEPAMSEGVRDGFVEEEGEEEVEVWRPHFELQDLSVGSKNGPLGKQRLGSVGVGGKKGGGKGEGQQQRRWGFAFKDTALEGAGPHGGTVIRDKTGRLRAASKMEEKARSWIQRSKKIVIEDHN